MYSQARFEWNNFTSVRQWASETIMQGKSNTKLKVNLSIIHVHNAT